MSRPIRWARRSFVAYAMLLFVLTHWPRLRIEGLPMERPDLVLHFIAFGTWTLLLALASWLGPTLGRRNIIRSSIIGAAYASLDEASQLIPALGRWPAWSDLFANLAGVGVAGTGMILFGMTRRRADTEHHIE